MENETEQVIKQTSSFELNKLSKGSYTWKVKIYSDDLAELKKRIDEMNTWALQEYGGYNLE